MCVKTIHFFTLARKNVDKADIRLPCNQGKMSGKFSLGLLETDQTRVKGWSGTARRIVFRLTLTSIVYLVYGK